MSISTTQVFAVPVLFQDVSEQDALEQIFASLQHLNTVTDGVFDRIQSRVATERNRLEDIKTRVNSAKSKIDTLAANSGVPTQVFASAKYPAASEPDDFVSLYENMPFRDAPDELGGDDVMGQTPAEERHAVYQTDLRRDMLGLYSRLHAKEDPNPACLTSGLGAFPSHLPSVANVLLFNSTENPYREYNTLDNLLGSVRQAEEADDVNKLAAAPTSLADGLSLPTVAGEEFTYRPAMKELEQFNLPSNLALPNVANLTWSEAAATDTMDGEESTMASIAPSALPSLTNALPALTNFAAAPAIQNDVAPPPPVSTAAAPAAAAAPPPPPVAPPPAPVAPPPAPVTAPPPPVAPVPTPAAAPAPAPAAAAAPAAEAAAEGAAEEEAAPAPASGNPMSGLLAALNNPDALKNLKKASVRKEDEKPPEKPKLSAQEQFMADLRSKFKSLSANKTKDKTKAAVNTITAVRRMTTSEDSSPAVPRPAPAKAGAGEGTSKSRRASDSDSDASSVFTDSDSDKKDDSGDDEPLSLEARLKKRQGGSQASKPTLFPVPEAAAAPAPAPAPAPPAAPAVPTATAMFKAEAVPGLSQFLAARDEESSEEEWDSD